MSLFHVQNPANGLRVCLSPYTVTDTGVMDLLNQFSWEKENVDKYHVRPSLSRYTYCCQPQTCWWLYKFVRFDQC
jgi:hypothetical protein